MPTVCLALCTVSKGTEKQGHMPAKDNFKLKERSPLHYCTILGLLDTNCRQTVLGTMDTQEQSTQDSLVTNDELPPLQAWLVLKLQYVILETNVHVSINPFYRCQVFEYFPPMLTQAKVA